MPRLLAVALLFPLSLARPGASQNPPEPQPSPRYGAAITVESAEGFAEPLDQAAPSATVLGRAEIEASEELTVADLLRQVAGVDVTRSGSYGRLSTVRIDGASSAQTLVLLDGMELNSPTAGVADLADLSSDDVERIEVVRGPMSALYGSQAMGGVINIVTRRGRGAPEVAGEVQGGAFGTWRGAVRSEGAVSDAFSYSFAASRLDSAGRRFDTASGPLEHDAYDNTTLSGGVKIGLGGATTLAVDGRFIDADRDLPIEVFGAQAFDVNSTQADRTGVLSLRLGSRLGARFEPELRLGYTRARQDFADPIDPGESGPFASDFASRVDSSLAQIAAGGDLLLGSRDRLTLGFEWEQSSGENRDSFSGENFDHSEDTRSVFAQNRWSHASLFTGGDDELVITAGLRVDDVESFGTTVNPKVSALWTAPGGVIRLRGGAGRGFRAPSLNELVFPFFGNPDLEPEVSRTYEAAVGGRTRDGRFDAEVRFFRTDYDDLIASDPVTFLAENLASARVTGAAIEGQLHPTGHWWIRASYTHQNAVDRTGSEDQPLVRRPDNKGALSVIYDRPAAWRLAVDLVAVGESPDTPVLGLGETNPAWTRVDLAGAYTLPFAARRLEAFGRIENLGDGEYSELLGYPAPGINARAGLRARW